MMSEELKPCPFCGGPAELIKTARGNFFVQCACCCNGTLYYRTEKDAVQHWNRRAEAECEQ